MDRVLRALQSAIVTDVRQFPIDIPFKQIDGWDSMRAVNFQLELEQEFGVDLSTEQITGNSTLADVIAILRRRNIDIESR